MFAALLALIGAVALWSAYQPWYSFATAGTAACERPAITAPITVRTPVSNTAVDLVYATGCVSGREIALQSVDTDLDPSIAQAMTQLDYASTTEPPAVLFGLPRPVSLLLVFVGVGMLGLASRNRILGLVAVIGFYYVHKDLGAFTAAMSAGDGGTLNVAQPNSWNPAWALVLGWGLLASATLFVAKHNADERTVLKRAALAAGEAPPPSMLDHVFAFAGGKIGVAMEAAPRERNTMKAAD